MRKRLYLLFFILTSITLTGSLAKAGSDGLEYDGIDVVFLVDQSGSMGGLDGAEFHNDPLGLRFYSLTYAAKWMGENYIGVDDNKMPFRIAIVNFGGMAEIWDFNSTSDTQYWQEIAPVSRADWDTLYKKIETNLNEMKEVYETHSLGRTDFALAFERAQELFESEEYESLSEGGNHQRVIVLLTDGAANPNRLPIGGYSEYRSNLLEYSNVHFPEPEFRIYVIGMQDQGEPYWSDYRSYWENLTHDPCRGPNPNCLDLGDRASLVASNQEVGNHFLNILIDLTDFPEPPIVAGLHVLPPYLRTAIFTLFKSSNEENLILTDPLGNVITQNDPGVQITGSDGPIEVVRINSPIPGEWLVETSESGERVIITKREIFATGVLESPVGEQIQYLPVEVRYSLVDEAGDPLPDYGGEYTLVVEAELSEEGKAWPLILKTIGAGNVYEGAFTPLETGSYSIFVHAWSKDAAGETVDVYNEEIGTFAVSPVILNLTDLPSSWPQYQGDPLSIELRTAEGLPISTELLEGSQIKITASLTSDGDPDGTDLLLAPQQDGTYSVEYAPQLAGEHIVNVLATLRDADGNMHIIADEAMGRFEVDPTVKVVLEVMQPTEPISVENDTFSWSLSRVPTVVQVSLRDAQGNPIDPREVFDDPETGLQLEFRDDNDVLINDAPEFQLNPVNGQYTAESVELGVGDYAVTVIGGELKPGYVYDEEQISLQITRVTNPWLIASGAILLATVAVVSSTTAYVVVNKNRRQQHPCKGKIIIVDGVGAPKFTKTLDGYNSNRIFFSTKEIPQMTMIRRILVECTSEADHVSKSITVSVWPLKGKTPIVNRERMRPESERRIGRTNFWILKDPSPEQQLAVRLEDNE